MTDPAQVHVPVLRETCIDLLAPALGRPDAVVVDATLGMGGHSHALLERFPEVRLVGIDRDPAALDLAGRRLAGHRSRIHLVHAVYDRIGDVLSDLGLETADGILFDLGVSSLQLDQDERGFSYARDTPLDMRMDPTDGPTAAHVLNTYSVEELTRVLREYGQERFARRIASAVVAQRDREPFTGSARLVQVIRDSVPAATRRTGGNPAKRTFQALRVEVNAELAVLAQALPAAIDALAVGGRIVVMSYQSLEDRITKRILTRAATSTAPPDLPVVPPDQQPVLELLTRGAVQADEAEVAANPRAASVRLRAARKLRSVPPPERSRSWRRRVA
ncbi:MAG: 16S rRNA (cytosine(1402)-N(4))-methyltransferase RsmH [Actinomycetales bacterium]